MPILNAFPTLLYQGRLPRAGRLNRELKREIEILAQIDDEGRRWSRSNYQEGYSSYSSMTKLHLTSPGFGELERLLRPHVKKYVQRLSWNLMGRKLGMTTCWANLMKKGCHHTMHTHPLSQISGVYYVSVPKGSSHFKIEDPRLGFMMASPPRLAGASRFEQNYVQLAPKDGEFLLFESWLRHEVPPHRATQPRFSVSFNFEF
ncbi:MAG: TIGR02466 family protein [Bdellovibrionales bacterium]